MKLLPLFLLIALLPATARPTKKFLILVDTSGSMETEGKITKALEMVKQVARQPVDEGMLTAYTFDENVLKYPHGWEELPSLEGCDRIQDWLSSTPTGGGTFVCPALAEALKDPTLDLTVILVTDGLFPYESLDGIERTIKESQAKRAKPAIIGVLGVGHSKPSPGLMLIARLGKGGYYVEEEDD